jgi:polar amino acid transport system ATP-binding protein
MLSLPIIDLAAVRSGEPDARKRVAQLLDATCRTHGFFYVTGHGVSPELR